MQFRLVALDGEQIVGTAAEEIIGEAALCHHPRRRADTGEVLRLVEPALPAHTRAFRPVVVAVGCIKREHAERPPGDVARPEDAFHCFMGTELDVLAREKCLLIEEEEDPSLKRDYKDAFELD